MAMSAEQRSKYVALHGNGGVSKWMKHSRVGRKTPTPNNKQQTRAYKSDVGCGWWCCDVGCKIQCVDITYGKIIAWKYLPCYCNGSKTTQNYNVYINTCLREMHIDCQNYGKQPLRCFEQRSPMWCSNSIDRKKSNLNYSKYIEI